MSNLLLKETIHIKADEEYTYNTNFTQEFCLSKIEFSEEIVSQYWRVGVTSHGIDAAGNLLPAHTPQEVLKLYAVKYVYCDRVGKKIFLPSEHVLHFEIKPEPKNRSIEIYIYGVIC